jgi:ABC-type transport system involved in multi-copper enzyme maturation permease subunit
MTGIFEAIKAEYKKASRSVVLPVTFIVSAMLPAMLAFMMFVVKNPELSHKLGLVGTKAKLMGTADWPSFFLILAQAVSAIEIVIFGFICSWIFGREYLDRTAKDLLALPIPRTAIVSAKLIIAAAWSFALYFFIFVVSMAGGFAVGLPMWNEHAALRLFLSLCVSSIAVIYLNSVVAFIACATRGYLAAVGFVILSAIFINFTGAIGFAEVYPWAVPMLYALKTGGAEPGVVSWIIVLITGAAGIAVTMTWWRYADQN